MIDLEELGARTVAGCEANSSRRGRHELVSYK